MANLLTTRTEIESGVVSIDALINLRAAYQQDSAPAVNWLISMIQILREQIRSNGVVLVCETKPALEIRSDSEFMDWIRVEFPDIASMPF